MTFSKNGKAPGGGLDRRAAPRSRGGILRRLRGLFVRPIAVERKGMQVNIVLVDRRSGRKHLSETTSAIRDELGARLVSQAPQWNSELLHLKLVHEALGKQGWGGVKALPSRLLAKAEEQAQALCRDEPSDSMQKLVDRLAILRTSAMARDERATRRRPAAGAPADEMVVGEATHEEFQELKRHWAERASGSDEEARSVEEVSQSFED